MLNAFGNIKKVCKSDFFRKRTILLHMCATCSKLPSYRIPWFDGPGSHWIHSSFKRIDLTKKRHLDRIRAMRTAKKTANIYKTCLFLLQLKINESFLIKIEGKIIISWNCIVQYLIFKQRKCMYIFNTIFLKIFIFLDNFLRYVLSKLEAYPV